MISAYGLCAYVNTKSPFILNTPPLLLCFCIESGTIMMYYLGMETKSENRALNDSNYSICSHLEIKKLGITRYLFYLIVQRFVLFHRLQYKQYHLLQIWLQMFSQYSSSITTGLSVYNEKFKKLIIKSILFFSFNMSMNNFSLKIKNNNFKISSFIMIILK